MAAVVHPRFHEEEELLANPNKKREMLKGDALHLKPCAFLSGIRGSR